MTILNDHLYIDGGQFSLRVDGQIAKHDGKVEWLCRWHSVSGRWTIVCRLLTKEGGSERHVVSVTEGVVGQLDGGG